MHFKIILRLPEGEEQHQYLTWRLFLKTCVHKWEHAYCKCNRMTKSKDRVIPSVSLWKSFQIFKMNFAKWLWKTKEIAFSQTVHCTCWMTAAICRRNWNCEVIKFVKLKVTKHFKISKSLAKKWRWCKKKLNFSIMLKMILKQLFLKKLKIIYWGKKKW